MRVRFVGVDEAVEIAGSVGALVDVVRIQSKGRENAMALNLEDAVQRANDYFDAEFKKRSMGTGTDVTVTWAVKNEILKCFSIRCEVRCRNYPITRNFEIAVDSESGEVQGVREMKA